ncbi:MAG: hydrogenase iron-sulfur subunit [Candidatus Methanospirareceae archaeon]
MKEEPRIGVFVCHCGTNIGGVIDVPAVVEYVKTLPNVVHAEHNLYTCSSEGLSRIRAGIKEHNLNRVIVASCTPRTHEPLFRKTCEEAGLNPYLFEFVNIREQASWVHMHEPEKATEKAKDLIRMGVAKAALLEPQEEMTMEVERKALVIGGGVAGMTAALSIASRGFDVYLVEKEAELGGLVRNLYKLYPTNQNADEILESMIKKVKANKKIHLYTSATVKDISGYIGNFNVQVERANKEISSFTVGTIIVATGAKEFEPSSYRYGEHKNIITQLQLEKKLREKALGEIDRVVMIQCVGARGEELSYCGRICCMIAIKNAIILREEYGAEVYILHDDIAAYGQYEDIYRRAKELGVRFVKYSRERKPEVEITEGKEKELAITVYNEVLGREIRIECDYIVLSTPLVQHQDGMELSKMLRVPLGGEKFFYEAHVKLRPVDFATDGIFVCGTAHFPKDIPETIAQALGAASRASIPLSKGFVQSEAIVSRVNKYLCVGCQNCEVVCPYGAIKVYKEKVAMTNPMLCKGCGTCAVNCPEHAITMQHFTDEQLEAMVEEALKFATPPPEGEPKIVAFLCNWCSYAGADLAGVSRFQYPTNIRAIRVMCSGRVDPLFILKAFSLGADGVLVGGCHIGDCHYISGNINAEKRIKKLKEFLASIGIEPERLRLEWVSASEGLKFAQVVRDFTEQLKKMGPSPLAKVKLARMDKQGEGG